MHAVFKPIDWRCNLFSTGDREIRGEAVWIAPAEARINEHIWLRRLRLFFSIQGWSPSSEDKAEDLAGGLKYSPPWEAPELGLKHEAQIFIDLRVNSEQFADLWDRSPERLPQHVFIEIEDFMIKSGISMRKSQLTFLSRIALFRSPHDYLRKIVLHSVRNKL